MNESLSPAPYTVLMARGVGARSNEMLNAGIVLYGPGGPWVSTVADVGRLRALHPDYSAIRLQGWAEALEEALREHSITLPEPAQQHALLGLLASPFVPSKEMGLASVSNGPAAALRELMRWLVDMPARTLKAAPAPRKKATRLVAEIRSWLRAAKVYSSNIEDLGRGKVVANYPIDPGSDLYADFAVLNGKLNAIETLDLRGVERLTPTLRGDAAIKGVTLDEARSKIDGRKVVVLSATDYAAARPAIQLISRYADDVWDLQEPGARQKLASFIASALHREALPELELSQLHQASALQRVKLQQPLSEPQG